MRSATHLARAVWSRSAAAEGPGAAALPAARTAVGSSFQASIPSTSACRWHKLQLHTAQPVCDPSIQAAPPAASSASHSDPPTVGRLNHVAIAVPDLEVSVRRWRDVMGAQVSQPQPLPEHGVTVVFVELGNTKLELLAPLGERSPIARFLEKHPAGGLHHVCLEVNDVKASLEHVSQTVRVLDPQPKIGAHGNPVVFLHPKDNDGMLLELEQVGVAPQVEHVQ